MILAARNWLASTSGLTIAHGGSDAGTNITSLTELQKPYCGSPFVSTRGGSTTGGAFVTFLFGSNQPFRTLGLLRHNLPWGCEVLFELRTGGAGGTVVWTQTETVAHQFDSFARHTSILLPSRTSANYVKIEWRTASAARQFQCLRFWGSDALVLKPKSYALKFTDNSVPERAEDGPLTFVEGFRKRTIDIELANEEGSALVLPIDDVANLDSVGQLVHRVGASGEVLLNFRDVSLALTRAMELHGRLATLQGAQHVVGPKFAQRLSVKEFG